MNQNSSTMPFDLSKAKLWSHEELLDKIENDAVKLFAFNESNFWTQNNGSKIAHDWLSWCDKQKLTVKVVDFNIPNFIMPNNINACLYDMKVSSRGPDDTVYNQNEDLRHNVARGNSVLYLNDLDEGKTSHDGVIFALRKFTGGMGDEDENQPDSDNVWKTYFLEPVSSTSAIVCTEKANGEAAHLSARYIRDRFYLIVGSKNVHMIIGKNSDVDQYKDSRFLVAKTVGQTVLDLVSTLTEEKLEFLLNFLHHTKVTGVFEVLQPHYQHVVDLSYLNGKCGLKFITWTSSFQNEESKSLKSYCSLRPDAALDFAQFLGFDTVKYSVIPASEAEARMDNVRREHGYEGEVFYFMNSKGNVIGLLKKKTAWYVVARAIREKASSALAALKKDPSENLTNRTKKSEARLRQIQTWLGFSNAYLEAWIKLNSGFMNWLFEKVQTKSLKYENIRGVFPLQWKSYLEETNQTDVIEW